MSGSFGEMGNILAQAQKMQKNLEEAREELRAAEIDGVAGGGMVQASVNGMGEIQTIKINDDQLAGEPGASISELVVAAVRDAQTRAKSQHDERLSQVTGGMNLPNLF